MKVYGETQEMVSRKDCFDQPGATYSSLMNAGVENPRRSKSVMIVSHHLKEEEARGQGQGCLTGQDNGRGRGPTAGRMDGQLEE